uniref:Uncharacterized protein n=1 Tax=Ignisphaera aggregans TaxID=334771 RepID=A0A7J3JQ15_9CREN
MKIVVYDLVSENHKIVKELGLERKFRNLRIYCTRLLYSLGIPSTESVVIVSHNNYNRIEEVISQVKEKYEDFYYENNLNLPKPIIKQLELTFEQGSVFLEVAKNRLLTTIDEQIDKLVSIYDSLQINGTRENVDKLLRNMKRIRREWAKVKETCLELGINVESQIDYLINVCDDLIQHLQTIRGV